MTDESESQFVIVEEISIFQTDEAQLLVVEEVRTEFFGIGIQGAPGTSGGLKFIHTQAVSAAEWIVNHNLGEKPMAEIRNSGGQVIDAEVLHISVNQLRIYFSFALSGEVRCL